MVNAPTTENDILSEVHDYTHYTPSDETIAALIKCVTNECERLNAEHMSNRPYGLTQEAIQRLPKIFIENTMAAIHMYPKMDGAGEDLVIYENGKFNSIFEHLVTEMNLGIHEMEGRYEVLRSMAKDFLERNDPTPIGTPEVKLRVENGKIILIKTPRSRPSRAVEILSKLDKVTFE